MGRPQLYQRERVLQHALDVFWQLGYNTTSIQDLVDATGMHRGSLYAAFGSKRDLFIAVLDYYFQQQIANMLALFAQADSPLEGMQALLQDAVAQRCSHEAERSCLLVKSLLELGAHDSDIKATITHMLQQTEQRLADQLAALQQQSHPAQAHFDPELLAKHLLVLLCGLSVYSQVVADPQSLQTIVTTSLPQSQVKTPALQLES